MSEGVTEIQLRERPKGVSHTTAQSTQEQAERITAELLFHQEETVKCQLYVLDIIKICYTNNLLFICLSINL